MHQGFMWKTGGYLNGVFNDLLPVMVWQSHDSLTLLSVK
jgi:hypothetical protein